MDTAEWGISENNARKLGNIDQKTAEFKMEILTSNRKNTTIESPLVLLLKKKKNKL